MIREGDREWEVGDERGKEGKENGGGNKILCR